ncbi:MAG: holin family protein [Caudoviricetes sp.]|nr:MAG: holin family protein [Caudoviricetes sp.]
MSKMESGSIVSGNVASYVGAGTAVVGGLSASEIGIWVGSVVAILGLVFTQYWSWKRDRRLERELKARDAERKFRRSLSESSRAPVYHKDTDIGALEDQV